MEENVILDELTGSCGCRWYVTFSEYFDALHFMGNFIFYDHNFSAN